MENTKFMKKSEVQKLISYPSDSLNILMISKKIKSTQDTKPKATYTRVLFKKLGIKDVIIDPGFGFAKTIEQNYFLLKNLKSFEVLGLPVLVGISRKSMIYKALEIDHIDTLNGTTALNMFALTQGANLLRVHDVKEAKEAIKLFEQLNP